MPGSSPPRRTERMSFVGAILIALECRLGACGGGVGGALVGHRWQYKVGCDGIHMWDPPKAMSMMLNSSPENTVPIPKKPRHFDHKKDYSLYCSAFPKPAVCGRFRLEPCAHLPRSTRQLCQPRIIEPLMPSVKCVRGVFEISACA